MKRMMKMKKILVLLWALLLFFLISGCVSEEPFSVAPIVQLHEPLPEPLPELLPEHLSELLAEPFPEPLSEPLPEPLPKPLTELLPEPLPVQSITASGSSVEVEDVQPESVEVVTFTRDLVVHFLDVGQADSIFIQLPNGENMLIDGGEAKNASSILIYLRSLGVTTIDYLVATHPHADHIGGLPDIINAMDVLNIFMPRVSHTTQTFERLLTSIQNKGLQIDQAIAGVNILLLPELEVGIIGPMREDYRDLNDHSAVIKIIFGSTSFLFMGDAEGTSEGHITTDVSADVLKVGHHGSKTSTSAAFLRRVAPSYAVISVGSNNSYGHPTDEVLARLDAADVDVYRTDMVGTIVFISDGESIIIDKAPSPYQPQAPPAEAISGGGTSGGSGSGSETGTSESSTESSETTVYITRTGQRYHNDGCRHLARSKIETTLNAAKAQGLTACGTCRPPE